MDFLRFQLPVCRLKKNKIHTALLGQGGGGFSSSIYTGIKGKSESESIWNIYEMEMQHGLQKFKDPKHVKLYFVCVCAHSAPTHV